jgi:hypothetical protein
MDTAEWTIVAIAVATIAMIAIFWGRDRQS